MSWKKKLVFALVVAAGVILLCEAAGQVLFRLRFGLSPYAHGQREFKHNEAIISDHPYLPYLLAKGERGGIAVNRWGDRGPEPETPKRRVRVVCYGGSTTFDAGSKTNAETWPGRVGARLGMERVEMVNAGLMGGTTADSLVRLSLQHLELTPDVVVVYHGVNDLEPSFAQGFQPDYNHRRQDCPQVPYLFDRAPRSLDHFALWSLARLAMVGYRGGDLWSRYTRTEARYDFAAGPRGLPVFRRNLRSIRALAEANGARVVFCTFLFYRPLTTAPAFNSRHGAAFGEAFEAGIHYQNEIIRELGREEGALVADVAGATPLAPELFTDCCHLTADGNNAIAAVVAKALAPLVEEIEAERRRRENESE